MKLLGKCIKQKKIGGGGSGRGTGVRWDELRIDVIVQMHEKIGGQVGGDYSFNPSFTHSVYYTNPNSRSEDAIMPKESIIVIFSYVKD